MNDQIQVKTLPPAPTVEKLTEFTKSDLNDLCDATISAIENGGGFGWLDVPQRDILERYWEGVLAMPARILFVARLDGVICGTCQLVRPPRNNEAQAHTVELTTNFVAPWARAHGLAQMLLKAAESEARAAGFSVINLDVRETMTAAIRLYESAGYERFGIHPYSAKVNAEYVRSFYYYKIIDKEKGAGA